MRSIALIMSLILLLVPLAGCTGPDAEVTVDITSEELQQLINDNQEDFLNNTTIVVFQEYHNNTSVVNQFSNNSTSNTDQSGASSSSINTTNIYNGSSGQSEIFVVSLQWDASDMFGEIELKRNNNFTVSYSYYDYATNDDRTDVFTLPCSNYYDAPVNNNDNNNDSNDSGNNNNANSNQSTYWENNDNYYDWWDYLYNNTIRELLSEKGYSNEVENACRESDNRIINMQEYYYYDTSGNNWEMVWDFSNAPIFFEMNLSTGLAINVIRIISQHQYDYANSYMSTELIQMAVNGAIDCQNYHYVICTQGDDELYGGWEDVHLQFQMYNSIYYDSTFSFVMYYELVPVTNV